MTYKTIQQNIKLRTEPATGGLLTKLIVTSSRPLQTTYPQEKKLGYIIVELSNVIDFRISV